MKNTLKGIVSRNITVTAIFREEEDGRVRVDCPEIPGCVVTGNSRRDATHKIKAAIEGCLKMLLKDAHKRLGRSRSRTAGIR